MKVIRIILRGNLADMRYCHLLSERKVIEIFEGFFCEDYFLYIDDCFDDTCRIVMMDFASSEPSSFCRTWKGNLIFFSDEDEKRYKRIDQPEIKDINPNSITISTRKGEYFLKYDGKLTYRVGQRILWSNPSDSYRTEKGTILSVLSDEAYLSQNDYIPRYKVIMDDGEIRFFDGYQITDIES